MNANQPPRPRIQLLPTFIIAAIAISAGILAARLVLHYSAPVSGRTPSSFPVARALPSFHLVNQLGKPFDNDSLRGSWTFLFFGYTHCPDVCPTTLSVLNSVTRKTGDIKAPVHVAFITVDPQRDTPQQLAGFIRSFNKDFIGVTGTEEEIGRITKSLGVLHTRAPDEKHPADYQVDHSASVFLIDPDGKYHALFTPPLSAEGMTAEFHQIVRNFPS